MVKVQYKYKGWFSNTIAQMLRLELPHRLDLVQQTLQTIVINFHQTEGNMDT